MSLKERIAARLKAWAIAHYSDGWDMFVETYDDKDYLMFVGDMISWPEVKKIAKQMVDVWQDRRADAAHYADEGF